jgi:hypothetical protein
MAEDTTPNEDEEEDKKKGVLPEGRRVVRKKNRKSRSSSRETLILKKREIMSEMPEPDESGPVDVRGQVERLRKAQKEQKKAESAPMEEKWGNKQHRRKGSRWLLLATFGVVIPLLAFVIATTLNRAPVETNAVRGAGVLDLGEEELEILPFDHTDPGAWFQENSVEAYDDAIKILDQVNAGETARSTLSLMRDKARTKERMGAGKFQWSADFNVSDPRNLSWEYGASGDTGYMVIRGKDSKFRNFRAYFVNTGRGLRLDWAATTAWSEVEVGSLVADPPALPVAVRAWIAKKPNFDSDGQKLLSWYQVLSADRREAVWVYTPSGSEADLAIKKELRYGLIVMDRIEEIRATLRLQAGGRGKRPNEFELIEFVSEEWVQP